MTDAIASPGTATRPGTAPDRIDFFRDGGRFVRLLVRGALLQLITFGFYRFWLTTDLRRHLWAHTSLNGESFEYTGRGRELLIGFLFALAILIPIYLVYFLIGIEFERLQAFASFPLVLFMALFGQFAIYRARRYRLSRTVWRGVRFWMSGSGWNYAFKAFGWQILVVLTLGLLYPWYARWRESYKMRHTFYGDAPGAFEARAGEFFRRGIGMWLLTVGGLIVLAGIAVAIGVANVYGNVPAGVYVVLSTIAGLWLIALLFVYPFFKALEWRWWAQGLRMGGVTLQSNLRGGQLLKIYLKIFGWILLLFVGWAIVAAGIVGIFYLSLGDLKVALTESMTNRLILIPIFVVLYLLAFLSIGVVQRFYGMHEIWRAVVSSLSIQGVASLEGVIQRGEATNALGEGLADGLDVGGF